VLSFMSDLQLGLTPGIAHDHALERGLTHTRSDKWVAFGADPTAHDFSVLTSGGNAWSSEHAVEVESGIALIGFEKTGDLRVTAFGDSPDAATRIIAVVRDVLPPAENPDREKVPVAFWTYGPHGPQSVTRDLDAPGWQEIVPNYAASTLGQLGKLFAPDFTPGHGGQFVLWHGEPGTGPSPPPSSASITRRSCFDALRDDAGRSNTCLSPGTLRAIAFITCLRSPCRRCASATTRAAVRSSGDAPPRRASMNSSYSRISFFRSATSRRPSTPRSFSSHSSVSCAFVLSATTRSTL
jgi:hypothetical protein